MADDEKETVENQDDQGENQEETQTPAVAPADDTAPGGGATEGPGK